ncbi:MAG: redoxin domain-containing protein [Ignavibacteriae bacterium]|nr:redoxin domain-containing protein [Ignavibacteriota bacterium]
MKKILLFLLIISVAAFAGDMKSLKIGDKAPSFVLKNYDGKEFKLEKLLKENKYTVLMWISTECPVSNAYNERMVKLYDTYAGKGIAFVGMNSNKAEKVSDIEKHSKDKRFKFVVLKDDMNKVADLYAAQVTPEVFVLDPKGSIVYHGRIDDSKNAEKIEKKDLAAALDALLAGKKIENAETKAFGCTVKRVEKPQLSE